MNNYDTRAYIRGTQSDGEKGWIEVFNILQCKHFIKDLNYYSSRSYKDPENEMWKCRKDEPCGRANNLPQCFAEDNWKLQKSHCKFYKPIDVTEILVNIEGGDNHEYVLKSSIKSKVVTSTTVTEVKDIEKDEIEEIANELIKPN